jgi:PAS domain S-box-containing protein
MLVHQKLQLTQFVLEKLEDLDSDLEIRPEKEQILVIDDTAANLKLVSGFLRKAGYDVRVARNGKFALNFLEKATPDLILLDVMMPEMDGFETCRRLKASPKTQDIPVILMTAINDSSDLSCKVKGLALGAVDYISKPIQLDEVLARIKTHLNLSFLTKQLQSQNFRLAQEIAVRKQREKEISFLLAITQSVSEAEDFNLALSSILSLCCNFIDWNLAEAWVPNTDGTYLEYFPYQCLINGSTQNSNFDDSGLEEFKNKSLNTTFTPGVGLPGRIWQSKQPEWLENIAVPSQSYLRHETAIAAGLKAGFGVPILVDDQVLAVLVFYKKVVTYPLPQLVEFLQAVATQVASQIRRKQVEEKLKASEERWQLALLGNNDGIYDWNLATGKTFISARWKEILGYDKQELVITLEEWKNRIHHDDFERVLSVTQDYIEQKIPQYQVEYRLRCKDNSYKWVASRGQMLWDEKGKPMRFVGSLRDISDRKQAELARQQSEAREREKAETLKLTLNELKQTQAQLIQSEKMSSLGRMVAGIAHEINNPVSFIQGNIIPAQEYFQDINRLLELYQQTYQNPTPEIQQLSKDVDLEFLLEDYTKLVGSLQIGAERIKQIVLSLRNFSRLDESPLKSVDIHQGIDNTLELLHNRIQLEGNHPEIMVVKCYDNLPKIKCYASQLNQVFMNLLENAIEAVENQPEPRIIKISTEITNHKAQFLVIRIADNGVGISQEVREKIFDPFFTTKPIGSGTGLGLAISHQIIVEQHSGRISCDSTPGKGTEIIVEIPVKD